MVATAAAAATPLNNNLISRIPTHSAVHITRHEHFIIVIALRYHTIGSVRATVRRGARTRLLLAVVFA